MSDQEEVVEGTTEAGPKTTVEQVQLTVTDMQAFANIIDLASRRGAFHGNELSGVGSVYNKLTAFLEYVAAVAEAKEAADAEESANEEGLSETASTEA